MKRLRKSYLYPLLLSVIAALPIFLLAGSVLDISEAAVDIDGKYQELLQLLDRSHKPPSLSHKELQNELDLALGRLIDFSRLGQRVIGKNRQRFSRREKAQLLVALETAVKTDLVEWHAAALVDGPPKKTLLKERVKAGMTNITYRLNWGDKQREIEISTVNKKELGWRIVEFKMGRSKLSDVYKKRINDLSKVHSFPGLLAELKGLDFIILEDFSLNEPGIIPRGWRWRKKDNDKEKLITVCEENENMYVNLKDRGATVIYAKEFKWDLEAFPYISWKWRIHAVPTGGDERFNETNDSAAAVYIFFSRNLVGVPKTVKYVWSTTLPLGAVTRREGIGRPWTVVAKSGDQGMGIWHTEVFNAAQAFRDTFKQDPPKKALGIAILTDANSTDSYSEADYDGFRLLRSADAGSGVGHFLKGGK